MTVNAKMIEREESDFSDDEDEILDSDEEVGFTTCRTIPNSSCQTRHINILFRR